MCIVVVSNPMIVSVPEDLTLDYPFHIVCTASGNPAPRVQWLRDDELIAVEGNKQMQTTTHGYERTSILTVTVTGKYTFKASNKHGEVKQDFISGKSIVSVFQLDYVAELALQCITLDTVPDN